MEKGFLLFVFNMVQYLLCWLCLSSLLCWHLCCLSNINNLGLKPRAHVQVPRIHQLIDLKHTEKSKLARLSEIFQKKQ